MKSNRSKAQLFIHPDRRPSPTPQASGFWEFWRRHVIAALVLFLVPWLLYGYAVSFGFVLDDIMVYSENKHVQKGLAGIPDIVLHDSFDGYLGEKTRHLSVGGRYRPLSLLTFAAECQLFGLRPQIAHAINILLYALTGLLLFRLLNQLGLEKPERKWLWSVPFLTALLWIVHPVHSEAVANIKGRDEILALLFSIWTLLALLKGVQRQSTGSFIAATLLMFLALLSKENALTLLAVTPLTLYFLTTASLRKILTATGLLGLAVGAYLLLRYQVMGYLLDGGQPVTGLMNNPFLEASTQQKQATIVYTLGLYLKLLVFPHPLTHDYYPYQIPLVTWNDWRPWFSLLANGGLLSLAFFLWRRKHPVAYGILFYFLTLSIVSNVFFPVGTFMNERFLYMPSVGFCLAVIAGLASQGQAPLSPGRHPYPVTATILLGTMLAGFALKTLARVPAWKDDMSLNRAGSAISTGSARANLFMGVALYNHGRSLTNRVEKLAIYREAESYIDRALKIYPAYPDALKMKAGVLGEIYQINRNLDKLLNGFGALLKVAPVPFVDEYLEYLNRRKNDVPKLLAFYHQMGWDWFARQRKNFPMALRYLNYAFALAPNDEQVLLDLARVHLLAKNRPTALFFAQKGAQIAPQNTEFQSIINQCAAP